MLKPLLITLNKYMVCICICHDKVNFKYSVAHQEFKKSTCS